MKKSIPYGKQFVDRYDEKSVLSSLKNDLITTGPLVKQFENQLSKYLKSKFTYVCSSGTAAIHLALMSIDLKKNDIILMPAINFIASYNLAINMQLKIYLIDVDQHTGQITPETVSKCIKKNNLKKIDLLKLNVEGAEYSILEDILNSDLQGRFVNLQIQFHKSYENKNRYNQIKNKLEKKYKLIWRYPWIWESWKLKH